MEERVYSVSRKKGFTLIFMESLRGFRESFFLAIQLSKRDYSAQYRQSILGFVWSVVPVITSAALWIFLKGTGTISISATKLPYPLFIIIGTTLWSLLNDCLLMTTSIVGANRSIITKINFPKEALITMGLIKLIVNLVIKLLLIVILLFYYKVHVSLSVFMLIPLFLITIAMFVSIGIFITPFGLLYTDVVRGVPVIMQVLMYLSPVVYAVPEQGVLAKIMKWNPMAYILTDVRNCLTGLPFDNWYFFLALTLVTLLISAFALVVYRISIPILTERLST